MRIQKLNIENVKCRGCANKIIKEISTIPGVRNVTVDVDDASISYRFEEGLNPVEQVIRKLESMGYPEQGSNSNMNRAKSYVSCMIGRMTKEPVQIETNKLELNSDK